MTQDNLDQQLLEHLSQQFDTNVNFIREIQEMGTGYTPAWEHMLKTAKCTERMAKLGAFNNTDTTKVDNALSLVFNIAKQNIKDKDFVHPYTEETPHEIIGAVTDARIAIIEANGNSSKPAGGNFASMDSPMS